MFADNKTVTVDRFDQETEMSFTSVENNRLNLSANTADSNTVASPQHV